MLKRSTILHLRIPFSLYLLPFFCFAISQAEVIHWKNMLLSGFIIHILFYPASNGFNSYFDKDEESIGGLKHPPKVDIELYNVSLFLDAIALLLGLLINVQFTIMLFIMGIASKAYSHPKIRLKKYPFIGLLTVAIFQGAFTYVMSLVAIEDLQFSQLNKSSILYPACICSLLLMGSYPMTQIYQHGEDGRRGDQTISRILGIKGTFLWTGFVFLLAIICFFFFFKTLENPIKFTALLLFLSPVLLFFFKWFFEVLKDEKLANFESTMLLNKLSAFGFIGFFIYITIFK